MNITFAYRRRDVAEEEKKKKKREIIKKIYLCRFVCGSSWAIDSVVACADSLLLTRKETTVLSLLIEYDILLN